MKILALNKGGCGRLNNVHILIPGTYECLTLYAKGLAAMIKLRILRRRECPELSRWALHVTTSVLIRGMVDYQRREGNMMTEAEMGVILLKDGRRSHSQGTQSL